mmetsp:Transcript_635/g.1457  ORF Transcript_635/g.1457 Transcript_635/m.1457 type:complete len:767 (-) Transcript_635:2005-4305(-)
MNLFTLTLLASAVSISSAFVCPNQCNNRGVCIAEDGGKCQCFPGYHGVDCSYKLCPSGNAWFDHPSADNVAHADFVECSNAGKCNRLTGQCECRVGLTGPACDRVLCPYGKSTSGADAVCSGHGRCMSLRDVSNFVDYEQFFSAVVYTEWDADMIYGCDCDSGWEGSGCHRKSCPKGDDPTTSGVSETQVIDCTCSDLTCAGTVQLTFKGQTTPPIPVARTGIRLLEYRLEELSSVRDVTVTQENGDTICSVGGSVTKIEFKLPQGDAPDLILTQSATFDATMTLFTGGSASVIKGTVVSRTGTTEYVECSAHGWCDYDTGSCDCYDGYGSSDGAGSAGTQGDCGFKYLTNVTNDNNGTLVTTLCPFEMNIENATQAVYCSGHGTCNAFLQTCSCDAGYTGYACEFKTCPAVTGWFGSVGAAHANSLVCAGVGDCDYTTGKCENCGGNRGVFSGDNCEYLDLCAANPNSADACNGNGQCLTLQEHALLTWNSEKDLAGVVYSTPWDKDIIRGCSCYRSYSIDGVYDATYVGRTINRESRNETFYDTSKFYRGEQAFAVSDWVGFACDQAACPTGLDPSQPSNDAVRTSNTTGGNEIQHLYCTADSGTFTITFRGNTTGAIAFDATIAQLEASLEQIYTIHDVKVTAITGQGTTLCSATGVTTAIEFMYEFGDLPLMTSDRTKLWDSTNTLPKQFNHGKATFSENFKGTKIDYECSRQGYCNADSGRCECLLGYQSSSGDVFVPGERGDCSYYNKYYTLDATVSATT